MLIHIYISIVAFVTYWNVILQKNQLDYGEQIVTKFPSLQSKPISALNHFSTNHNNPEKNS